MDVDGQTGGSSPVVRLFNTLLVTFVTIFIGTICVQLGLLVPGRGDLKAMEFYTGKIAFPILIFVTVSTAELGAVDVGTVASCTLGKLLVFAFTWGLTFVAYQAGRSNGQRVLTATIFAFFAISSNDFAIGFPVVDALYGETLDMGVYIAANALVGSVLFVPLTTILLTKGQAMQGQGSGSGSRGALILDILLNPVITCTILALLYKLILGSTLTREAGKLKLPHPLSDVTDLLTSSFAVSALFLTGTSLEKPSVKMWPSTLVLMKVVVCAYLSYFVANFFVTDSSSLSQIFRNFTFFYGCIPSSSASLVFAGQFDPGAQSLIATAILLGLVLAGPIMFTTALFLEQEDSSMADPLAAIQKSVGIASLACGAAFASMLFWVRRSWGAGSVEEHLLSAFACTFFIYELLVFLVNPSVQSFHCDAYRKNDRTLLIYAIGWLQNASRFIVLVLQCFSATHLSSASFGSGHQFSAKAVLACLLAALLPAFLFDPNTLNEICQRPANSIGSHALTANLVWSLVLLAATVAITAFGLVSGRSAREANLANRPGGAEELVDAGSFGQRDNASQERLELERSWATQTVWRATRALAMLQAVKFLTQAVNTSEVLSHRSVSGSFAQMLVLESFLEHGQLLFLMVTLLTDEHLTRCMTESLPNVFAPRATALAVQASVAPVPVSFQPQEDQGPQGHPDPEVQAAREELGAA